MEDSADASPCRCKVGTVATEYGFDGIHSELVERWVGDRGESGTSVRSLADRFNQRILRAELRAADVDLVEGRVENLHSLLTDKNRLEAVQLEAKSSLEREGVNVEKAMDKFCSHQTIYRHLRNCLDAEKEKNVLSKEHELDRVGSIQHRTEAVVEDSIKRLRDGNKLDIGEFEVLVNVRVTCESCGTLHDSIDLIERGGCDCRR